MELRLPNAPAKYDAHDQAALRRAVEAFARRPLALYSENGTTARFEGSTLDLVSQTAPIFRLWEMEQAVDERAWRIFVDAKVLRFDALDDANSAGIAWLEVTRGAGTAISGIGLKKPTTISASFSVTVSAARFFQAGETGLTHIRFDDNSRPDILTLSNADGSNTSWGMRVLFNMGTAQAGSLIPAGAIIVSPEVGWTSTTSTQDALMTFQIAQNGGLITPLQLSQAGTIVFGDLLPGTSGSRLGSSTEKFFTCNVDAAYLVDGTQVLAARVAGWGTPTGTLSRATFDQSTVTLPQLAQRVAALITDLKVSHGMLGA